MRKPIQLPNFYKMDNASLFIGLSLLAIFIIPVVYVLIVQHSKERRYKDYLKKIAEEYRLNLNKMEFYYPVGLGLDSGAKKLLVADLRDNSGYEIIDLKQTKKIRLSVNHSDGAHDKSRKEKIFHLSLCIESKINSKIKEIILYDEEDENSTDADIRLNEAMKWNNMLRETIVV